MNLTSEQVQAIREGAHVPIVPPEVGEECVLIRRDAFDRIMHLVYDDSPITDEENARLGRESGKQIGWDSPEMAEYDHYDENTTR
ncbi:MAG: hypothetical protein ACLQNE_15220 [Thermoguttaceae bacterium]